MEDSRVEINQIAESGAKSQSKFSNFKSKNLFIFLIFVFIGLSILILSFPKKTQQETSEQLQDAYSQSQTPTSDNEPFPNIVKNPHFKDQIATIFIIGGTDENENNALSDVYYLNTQSNNWQKAPNMLTARVFPAAATYNNKIYVFGDNVYNVDGEIRSVEEFDPKLNKWTFKTSTPSSRAYGRALTIGSKIYLISVKSETGENSLRIDVYSPDSNSWSRLKDAPYSKSISSDNPCSNVGSKIYCPKIGEQSYTLKLDTVSNTWTELPSENRSTLKFAKDWYSKHERLYALDFEADGNYIAEYDPAQDAFSRERLEIPIDTSYHSYSTTEFGSFLAFIGGEYASGPTTNSFVLDFLPPANPTWWGLPPLPSKNSGHSVVVLPLIYNAENNISSSSMTTLSGKITSVNKPLAGIKLHISPDITKSDFIATVQTNSSGIFTFSNLKPGTYEVCVQHQDEGDSDGIQCSLPMYKGKQTVDLEAGQIISDYNFDFLAPLKF